MGTLVFVCPTPGREVSTGVEVDRSNFRKLSRTKTAIFCPRLSQEPRAVGDLGLVGQRGSRSFGRCVDRLPLNDPIQFTSLVVRQAPRSCEELRLREFGPRVVFTR